MSNTQSRRRRRITLLAATAAGALATPLAVAGPTVAAPAPSSAVAAPEWFAYDRPAEYGTHSEMVQVPMRDGFELGCSISRPAVDEEPAPGQFPGILFSYTPYGAAQGAADSPYTRYFTERGYNVLSCDIRGTGLSPAEGFEIRWPIQGQDGHDAVEWLADQPWSTGKIGAYGTSYGGQTTLEVAAQQPPHLAAIAPNVSPMNPYEEIFYPGGVAADADWLWAHSPAVPDPTFAQRQRAAFAAHPTYDEYWQVQNVAGKHADIDVPVLLWGGWFDVFRAGAIGNYTGLRDAGNEHTHLVMGPWGHSDSWAQRNEPVGMGAHLAWFDRWLNEDSAAPLPSARVTSYEVAGEDGHWVELPDWPDGADRAVLPFGADGTLGGPPGDAGTLDLTVDPEDGPATTCLVGCPVPTQVDHAEGDESRLTFTSEPLEEAAVIAGRTRVHLQAQVPDADGNLVVKLMDVAPDGRVTEVATGWLKADPGSLGETLSAAQQHSFVVETQPSHWHVAEGHQLRVSVTTGDVPRIAPSTSSGVISVVVGGGGSFAEVPVVSGAVGPQPVNSAPVLVGVVDVEIAQGAEFDALAGVSATDEEDGDLTSAIVVEGTVDPAEPGRYELTYSVTDSDGANVSATRTVTVIAAAVDEPPADVDDGTDDDAPEDTDGDPGDTGAGGAGDAGDGRLPATGAPLVPLVVTGLLLALAGAVLVMRTATGRRAGRAR